MTVTTILLCVQCQVSDVEDFHRERVPHPAHRRRCLGNQEEKGRGKLIIRPVVCKHDEGTSVVKGRVG